MIGESLKTGRRLLGMCAITLLFPGMPTLAADPAESPEPEEIIVTAQKESQSLQEVPVSVKAITAEVLEAINAQSAEDYLRLVPSVSMTNLARGGNQIQIRGLGSNVGNVGTVAIFNDGVISPSRIQASGTFSEQDPAVFDVERIEVLRGPQGTLYGEGSFGGVINIISKRPTLDRFQAAFSGSWYDQKQGSSSNRDVAGMINVPLVNDVLGLRVVGYNYDHDGWIDTVGPVIDAIFGGVPATVLDKDANNEEVKGGRAILAFAPGEDFDATFIYKSEKLRTGALSIVSSAVIDAANAGGGTSFDPDYSQAEYFASAQRAKTDEAVLELNWNTGIGRFTSIGSHGTVDSNGSSGVATDSKAWNEELRLASDSDGPINWILGAYYRSADRDLDFTGLPLFGNKIKQRSVFGQAYWTFAPQWTATFGLRYERQKSEIQDKLNQLESRATFSSTVPKLAVDYQANPDSLYYASIAKGFRAGGANIDESIGSDPDFRAPFAPDSIYNYEIGSKLKFLEGTLTVNAALFYIDWKNIQIDQPIDSVINPPVGFIVVNGDKAHSYGIEADIYYNPSPKWSITAGGSLVNAEYDSGAINRFPAGAIPLKGQVLPSTPKYTANLSVQRAFDVTSDLEGYVRGDYTLRGSSFGDVPNDPAVGFFGEGNLKSGVSRIMNLRAGVRREVWDLQLFCTNVFDAHDSTFNFYDGGFVDQRAVLPPRTIGLNLRVHYN